MVMNILIEVFFALRFIEETVSESSHSAREMEQIRRANYTYELSLDSQLVNGLLYTCYLRFFALGYNFVKFW